MLSLHGLNPVSDLRGENVVSVKTKSETRMTGHSSGAV